MLVVIPIRLSEVTMIQEGLGSHVPTLRMQLVGGVGNQLFTYYAGAAIAGTHQMQLELDVSRSHPLITGHNSLITDFDLPGKWLSSSPESAPRLSLRQRTSLLFRHQLAQVQFLHRFRRVDDHSETIGWVPNILLNPPTKTLRGYFQTWRYAQIASEFGYPRYPQLKNESPQLKALISRADTEEPICLHIRRGDYLKVPEFGILGRGYYQNAVGILRDRGNSGPLWIFTDSPTIASELIDGEIITQLSRPTEELVLMSKCRAHVIANSTFSWWGAWLNESSPDVVAPSPWFKRGPEVRELIPPGWTTIPHQE